MLKFTYLNNEKPIIFSILLFIFAHTNNVSAGTGCENINYKNIKKVTVVSQELEGGATSDGSGVYFELIKLIYSPLGIVVETSIAPFIRLNMLLTQNKIDASVAFYSSDVAVANGLNYYITPKRPVNTERLTAIFKSNADAWVFPDSLAGKRVAWLDGYNYEKGIPVQYEYQRLSDQLQGLKLLQLGRIDYYIDNEYDIKRIIKKHNFDDSQYTMQLILENKLYISFSKTAKSKKLMDIFDCRMDELRKSGELEKLYRTWDIPLPPVE